MRTLSKMFNKINNPPKNRKLRYSYSQLYKNNKTKLQKYQQIYSDILLFLKVGLQYAKIGKHNDALIYKK